ncbi:hypothetical protein [Thermoanaerobacter wiegelii]|uniref:Uncharacterized protein n=1 Tax=Thermoanaerobacter wiegelii Rt8.B1 TaxID=697303 RepID=G2MRL1_9THEO|nr:hypothetical protein [Thermoanaerobacter wiegelii]AEM79742.1 hypothetical protein Thewi_2407 [Thermoanaerobacter wiegelii Rt8.B1]
MKKIIALVIITALIAAGYQVYKDDSKRMALEEKVKGVLYSIGDSGTTIIHKGPSPYFQYERKDLSPLLEDFKNRYFKDGVQFVLLDNSCLKIVLENLKVYDYKENAPYGKPGDLRVYANPKIQLLNSNIIPKEAEKYILKTRTYYLIDLKLLNDKLIIPQEEMERYFIIEGKLNYPLINTVLFNTLLLDEALKYASINDNSIKFLYANDINYDKSSIENEPNNRGKITVTVFVNNKLPNKVIYIKSVFQYKDGKFYEIKRESNVKEYVEWAKKNL